MPFLNIIQKQIKRTEAYKVLEYLRISYEIELMETKFLFSTDPPGMSLTHSESLL